MTNEEGDLHWHLKKEVSYGHLVTTIMLVAMLVGGWVNVEKRMTAFQNHLKSGAHLQAERRLDLLESQMAAVSANHIAIANRLDEIIRRLERIEDRLNGSAKHVTALPTRGSASPHRPNTRLFCIKSCVQTHQPVPETARSLRPVGTT